MDDSKSNDNNQKLFPPLRKCPHGCELEEGSHDHKCKAHGAALYKRCINYPYCDTNSNKTGLRGYIYETNMTKHLQSCIPNAEQAESIVDGQQKEESNTWNYAILVAEPLWKHKWGFIIKTHFNARRDQFDVIGHDFVFEDVVDFNKKLYSISSKLQTYDKIVFILAGDGKPGNLEILIKVGETNRKHHIPLETLLEPVKNTFKEKLVCIHLASCECMKPGSVEKLQESLGIPLTGYTNQVLWNDSAVIDLYFLMQLLDTEGSVYHAYSEVKKNMPPLVTKTGFTLWHPTLAITITNGTKKRKKNDKDNNPFATIGKGVEIRTSTIVNSGNGLFSDKQFKQGELITEFCGPRITRQEAQDLIAKSKHSHLKSIQFGMQIIKGLEDPEEAKKKKKGGGSFAKESPDGNENAQFVTLFDESKKKYRVLLKAIRDILPEQEILVKYQDSNWSSQAKKTNA